MALLDLIIINLAAVMSFLIREHFGDLVIKQAPSVYLTKYLSVLLMLNITYPLIFWVLGLYDRRQKRALLEDFILIFGVFSTSLAILIIFLFLGRLWWMSRIVLFVFWGLSIFLLCLSRLFVKIGQPIGRAAKIDLPQLAKRLQERGEGLKGKISASLSIVIVSTNELEKLKRCLESIRNSSDSLEIEIIVVNNRSQDGTLEFLKKNYPTVKIVTNQRRCGYPQSVNNGLKAATAEYCLILNPDIVVMPGACAVMLDYLIKHHHVGLVGCKLLNSDGTLQHSVRRFLDLRTYLYRFTPLRGLMAGSAIERYYLMQDWDHNDNRLVDWVLGGCMMVRKKAIEQVGLMDERFFLYFDDVDWCWQMWERGWQVAYVAEAAMFHQHMRTSANKLFSRATREHLKSLYRFVLKRGFKLPKNCPSSLE